MEKTQKRGKRQKGLFSGLIGMRSEREKSEKKHLSSEQEGRLSSRPLVVSGSRCGARPSPLALFLMYSFSRTPLAANANAPVLVCRRYTLASLTCSMQSVSANMDLNLSSMLMWYRMHMASCLWPSSAATQTEGKEGSQCMNDWLCCSAPRDANDHI